MKLGHDGGACAWCRVPGGESVDQEQRFQQSRVGLGGTRFQTCRLASCRYVEHLAGLGGEPCEELCQRGLLLAAGEFGDVAIEA